MTTCDDKPVLGMVRVYPPTNPGARARGSALMLLSPRKDIGIDPLGVLREAHKRYGDE